MPNWKELGEVPDSDDDDFDSQSLICPGSPVSGPGPSPPPPATSADDVWSVPTSPTRRAPKTVLRPTTPVPKSPVASSPTCSSPLSPPPPDLADISPGPSSKLATPRIQILLSTNPPNNQTPTTPQDHPDVALSPAPTSTLTPAPPPPTSTLSPSWQTAVRLERSLRPRKPIQEHPYLLEDAQYHRFMKAHGFKPVRVTTVDPEPPCRQKNTDDSQDAEFSAEESQEALADPLHESDESQPDFAALADDVDELAPSPSPKRSSQTRATSSGRPSPGHDTDNTSVLGDDDLPSIEELLRRRPQKHTTSSKRPGHSGLSPASKRMRIESSARKPSPAPARFKPVNIYDIESSPMREVSQLSRSPTSTLPDAPSRVDVSNSISPSPLSSSRRASRRNVISLLDDNDDDALSDASDSQPSAESDSEAFRHYARKLRGVLPASWLRLDQLNARKHLRKESGRRRPSPPPNKPPKKGVAIPKQSLLPPSTSSHALLDFLSSDNDDDDNDTHELDDINFGASPSVSTPTARITAAAHDLSRQLFLDDGDIPEEDVIDRMVVGTKRKRRDKGDSLPNRKKIPCAGAKGKTRQPKITTSFGPQSGVREGRHIGQHGSNDRATNSNNSHRRQAALRATPPPLLSVLDVVEPGAPDFLRIAARAAKRTRNQGKASPSRKQINLGNRNDNIDALSVLRDWKAGKIKPKHQVTTAKPKNPSTPATSRAPLTQRSANTAPGLERAASFSREKAMRQPQIDRVGIPETDNLAERALSPSLGPRSAPRPRAIRKQPAAPSSRPAQLETTETARSGKFGFLAGKRSLDVTYRRSKSSFGPVAPRLESFIDGITRESNQPPEASPQSPQPPQPRANANSTISRQAPKPRLRKKGTPRFIDLNAPQFVHATDPLPTVESFVVVHDQVDQHDEKLRGLGPFGTHYTHHFEIFPLDSGVYFHESTFIGRGTLDRICKGRLLEQTRRTRPPILFELGDKTLRWGPWDDNTSSEMGILVDSILDQVTQTTRPVEPASITSETIAASDFLLEYVLGVIRFSDDEGMKSFILKVLEVMGSFVDRLEATLDASPEQRCDAQADRVLVDILPRFLSLLFASLRLCQECLDLSGQAFQVEKMLKNLARASLRVLASQGLETLEKTYANLQENRYRERGIRSDRRAVALWVVLLKILNAAKVPRGGFWDIFGVVILTPDLSASSDVQQLERVWKSLFTLLPLSEFNNSGTLIAGSRHGTSSDGWAVPQAMLKRVFQLYQKNPRQPPSFNDYCRSLLGRCHYLIEQWGWGKSTAVIGLIFDFFGSQNLGHLRNEEVYKSPQFLEQLTASPRLSISPEDRCFHIFVKIVALTIKRLGDGGLIKDTKNLVTRILPNHNRQFSKEQTIHQHELAALRNHHDLLCTLFWAAPCDVRPGVHLIEKLVTPGSSHKEACLINMRAWSQLARFVVYSNEGSEAFRPFMSWQNSVFRHTLDQYLTAESDIQQQLLALSKDSSHNIGPEMVEKMVQKNKAAAMDVLYCSVQASFEVLKVAPSIGAASYSLNIYQLAQVFTKLDIASAGFDWHIVLVAIDTVDHFLDRIEKALERQYSFQSDGGDDVDGAEDATLLMEHQIVEALFSVTNRVLDGLETKVSTRLGSKESLCAEKAVLVSSRLASRFIQDGIARLSQFFMPGKYGLFRKMPHGLSLVRRRYLPLFTATLVKNNMFDFKDLGSSVAEMWMLAIAGPYATLEHVAYLAEVLRAHDVPWIRDAVDAPGAPLNYGLTRELFSHAISTMRRSLRETNSGTQRQQRADLGKMLRSTMDQMKRDLACVKPNRVEHLPYVEFVREIISLIKSHGVDVCPVDQFFYQISAEYSPSIQDPHLHLAGIVAYGIRFGEGELTAIPQLFYYLYNNFKVAVINDKLVAEINILERCMDNPHILGYMISRMLPAAVRATAKTNNAWPILHAYSAALRQLLGRSCVPKQMGLDHLDDVSVLLSTILSAIKTLKTQAGVGQLTASQLYVLCEMVALINVLQPDLTIMTIMAEESAREGLVKRIGAVDSVCRTAADALSRASQRSDAGGASDDREAALSASVLLDGICDHDAGLAGDGNVQVESFATHIASDVQRSWAVTDRRVLIRAPGNASTQGSTQGTTASQGIECGPWGLGVLLQRLKSEVGLWCLMQGPVRKGMGGSRRVRIRVVDMM